jgi:ketosteroid isomerase-like protein
MRKLSHLLIALAILATGALAHADVAEDEGQLRDLEFHCATALVNSDTQWLDSFYGKDWFLIGSDGQKFTRKLTLAQLESGQLKWVSCAFSDMDIHVFGDTAIVIYKAVSLGELNGRKIDETEICSDTFVRDGDSWRCVHSHNSYAR